MSEITTQLDPQTLFDAALYDLAVRMRQYDEFVAQRTEIAGRAVDYHRTLQGLDRTVDLADQPAEIAYAALGDYLAAQDVRATHNAASEVLENHGAQGLIGRHITVEWLEPKTTSITKVHRNEYGYLDSKGEARHTRSGTIRSLNLNAANGGEIFVRSQWLKQLCVLWPLISRENDYTPTYGITVR